LDNSPFNKDQNNLRYGKDYPKSTYEFREQSREAIETKKEEAEK
jgi:hypothetical protein